MNKLKVYKILNLYACLGGNRFKWNQVAEEAGIKIQVTAVELDEQLCLLYAERFSNDFVICADAHKYLLEHFTEFDFIWSSPPCQTHSRARFWNASQTKTKTQAKFPDLKLYEEIIFLSKYFKGLYCVENVIGYYEPLIKPQINGRHFYWSNFKLPKNLNKRTYKISGNKSNPNKNEYSKLLEFHKIDLSNYNGNQRKTQIARNLVDFEVGKAILATALNVYKSNENTKQQQLEI